jgi:hypothetical protein
MLTPGMIYARPKKWGGNLLLAIDSGRFIWLTVGKEGELLPNYEPISLRECSGALTTFVNELTPVMSVNAFAQIFNDARGDI